MKNATLYLIVILLAPLFLVAATSSLEYDPWSDLNADGVIDIFDVVTVAGAYLTTGDPTKEVLVANWPKHEAAPTLFQYNLAEAGGIVVTEEQGADGCSTLHMLIDVKDFATVNELVVFIVYGPLWNAAHNAYFPIRAYEHTFNYLDTYAAVSIPVPSDTFYFAFESSPGATCTVSLSYYLTWG